MRRIGPQRKMVMTDFKNDRRTQEERTLMKICQMSAAITLSFGCHAHLYASNPAMFTKEPEKTEAFPSFKACLAKLEALKKANGDTRDMHVSGSGGASYDLSKKPGPVERLGKKKARYMFWEGRAFYPGGGDGETRIYECTGKVMLMKTETMHDPAG